MSEGNHLQKIINKGVSTQALDLEKLIPNRFNRLLWNISNYGDRASLIENNISIGEWRIMAQLGHYGRMSIGKLSDYAGIGQTVGSRAIKSLKVKGCVETRTSKKDSRQQIVKLSRYGLELHDKIAPMRTQSIKQVQAGLTEQELECLFSLCDKLESHLITLTEKEEDEW